MVELRCLYLKIYIKKLQSLISEQNRVTVTRRTHYSKLVVRFHFLLSLVLQKTEEKKILNLNILACSV